MYIVHETSSVGPRPFVPQAKNHSPDDTGVYAERKARSASSDKNDQQSRMMRSEFEICDWERGVMEIRQR